MQHKSQQKWESIYVCVCVFNGIYCSYDNCDIMASWPGITLSSTGPFWYNRFIPGWYQFIRSYALSIDVSRNKLFKKYFCYQWFELPLRSCYVTAMKNIDRIMYMYDHIDLRGYIRRNVTNPQSACFE